MATPINRLRGEFLTFARRLATQFRQRFGGSRGWVAVAWHAGTTLAVAGALAVVSREPDEVTLFFVLSVACLWVGASSAVREIVDERDLLRNEMRAGLSVVSYVAAKLVYCAVLALADGSLLAIGLGIAGRLRGHLAADVVTCTLLVFCGAGIGLAISAMCTSIQSAMTILPLALIPQVMLSGFVFPVAFVPNDEAVVSVQTAGPAGESLDGLEALLQRLGLPDRLTNVFMNRSYPRLSVPARFAASRWGAETFLAFHTTELRVAPPDSNLKLLVINHTLGTLTFGREVRLQLRAALSGLIAQARTRKMGMAASAAPVPLDARPDRYLAVLLMLCAAKSAVVLVALALRNPLRDAGRY
jgi:ABC-type polysaccharide/polyol phosphate export permease